MAAPIAQPNGPQPDFVRVAQHFQDLSTELQHCQNLPAIAGSQRILDALDRLNERLDRIEQNVENITARMSASNHNSVARTQNSLLSGPDDDVTPLLNPSTNTAIPNFPATPRAIDQLQTQTANALLDALDQATNGSLAAKKVRIRIAIGLAGVRKVNEGA
ncbi:hypothetical protein D0861_00185 [Hortaea werneckii]|uniref:Uncharacterized protein n=1 Tax=Hortaea werneckii TaxID=91943 RepID=A0A3M7G692_HORWE|nr:hypothetical protein D0861_00185 [Hortaea werneckii]